MNVAIIPARGGSKGIPGKNYREFLGKPLLRWLIDACAQSSELNRTYVSTDNDAIAEMAIGAEVWRRGAYTAMDGSSTESVILEIIDALNNSEIFPTDNIILLQCTSPYTTGLDIDNCIRMLKEYDSVISCGREKRFFWQQDGTPLFYSPTTRPLKQQWGGLLIENGAIYASKAGFIQASRCRISGRIGIYEMRYSFELDSEEDWKIGEAVMK